MKKLITAPLLDREEIGAGYHVLTFDAPDSPAAAPGQFLMMRATSWGDAPLLPRPMSYLSGGDKPQVLIKVIGEGTARMATAQPGEEYSLLGPLGKTWPESTLGKTPILVAGGVGVAPLVFLARRFQAQGVQPVVLYGGRTDQDLPLSDLLDSIADLHVTTEDGSRGDKGRVTGPLMSMLNDSVEIFTCGPDRMMAAVATIAQERQVPCQASLEAPMACGFGVCLGCPVMKTSGEYLYTCVDGPCVNAADIDWNADQ
ncbi:MAG: dihydroorotate dehydrogenase electron transfer subunit [Polyangiaceae bacterium]|nr:dihydroorotate dehydrogenase electron transfer subunit [Polyangiaceae bacterium]